jgi:hypothetical protein
MARDALFNDVDLDTATDRLGQCVGQSAASFEAQVAFAATSRGFGRKFAPSYGQVRPPCTLQYRRFTTGGDRH